MFTPTNIETLITRSASAPEGVTEAEVIETFVAEGIPAEMAFLATVAGRIFASHVEEVTVSDEEG